MEIFFNPTMDSENDVDLSTEYDDWDEDDDTLDEDEEDDDWDEEDDGEESLEE